MGKSFGGSINVAFPLPPTLADKILGAHLPVADNIASTYVSSGSGINFSAVNSPTNGQGLYINSNLILQVIQHKEQLIFSRGNVLLYKFRPGL